MIHSANPRTSHITGHLSWRPCGKEFGAADLGAELDVTCHGAELGGKICGAELLAYTRRAAGRATPVSPVLSVVCSSHRRATPAATLPPARSTCGDPPPRARSGRPRASARRASCSRGPPLRPPRRGPPSLRRSRPARRTVLLSLRSLSRARSPAGARRPASTRSRPSPSTLRVSESERGFASRGARRATANHSLLRRHRAGLVDANYWRGTLRPRPILDWYLKRVDEVVSEARDICAPGLLRKVYLG
ncbi:hypothetical protein C2845_PM04G32060 [Panicum miliaceum]|uniref:Uncharacterized protein n=1 Tax=Panicum miliaceum TaxID=4540 RepID=A0A3L6QMQ0_PANMI|nr:hypothetical protein C2845_PM04G32060 [Panicum miliaceum]